MSLKEYHTSIHHHNLWNFLQTQETRINVREKLRLKFRVKQLPSSIAESVSLAQTECKNDEQRVRVPILKRKTSIICMFQKLLGLEEPFWWTLNSFFVVFCRAFDEMPNWLLFSRG